MASGSTKFRTIQDAGSGNNTMKTSSMTSDITKYALFLGGTNVAHDVLTQYDPLKTGYGRIFMVRKPLFLEKTIPDKMKIFKHIIEYGNTSINGIGDVTMGFNEMGGGYTNKQFKIPTFAEDGTDSLTIKVWEFSGSPIREVLHSWINGTSDLLTGLAHYNGLVSDDENGIEVSQANQTAEFIYVNTDNTGRKVEYACMFANCFPQSINTDVFNYNSGEHNLVETEIQFTATKYESIQINQIACKLIEKYRILANSLNFNSGITENDLGAGFGYDVTTGKLEESLAGVDTSQVTFGANSIV